MFCELSPKQINFLLHSDARINVMDGAIRSGKTHVMNLRWLEEITTAPTGDFLMVGKTIRTLERNVLKSQNGIFDLLGEGNFKYNSSSGELHINGRKIYCVGANDEKAENKIRGLTLVSAYGDEASLYPKSFMEQLQGRCSVKGGHLFFNTNPDNPFHYLKTDYLDNPDLKSQLKHWRFLMNDNPYLTTFNPEYIEYAENAFKGVFYRRNVLGEWAMAEGIIYDMFNQETMIVDTLPEKFDKMYVSCDYGTLNPCVFGLFGIKDGALYAIKEYYYDGREKQKQKTDDEYADDLVGFISGLKLNGIIVDPSAASFIAALRKKGVITSKAKNEVLDGIRNVSSLMSQGRFFVHRSCKNAIKELNTYSWDSKAAQHGEDKPIKDNDHWADCCRYIVNTYMSNSKLSTFNRRLLSI